MLFLPPPNGDFIQRGEDLSLPVSIRGRKRRPNKKKNFFCFSVPPFLAIARRTRGNFSSFREQSEEEGKGKYKRATETEAPRH